MTGVRTTKATRHLAVDLGAGSGRVVAGELREGRLTLEALGRFPTSMARDAATGYQCWELETILGQIQGHLERAAAASPVHSLGVDSWGVDYVLLDSRQQMVGKPVCYRDARTTGMMEQVARRMPPAEIYRRTGIQFQPFNTLYQLAATVEQQPAWIEQAEHLLMIPDYFHFRLSGVLSNEYTNATTTQMYALSGGWDEELRRAAGLQKNLMQAPVAAGTVLGATMLAGAPVKVVAPATHDTASAVAGAPLESQDEAYISSGTWSLMGIESRTPIASPQAMRLNFTNEGGLEGRFRVLKNIMGMWPIQRICEEHAIADVSALGAEAAALPAWRSLIHPNDPAFLNPRSMTEAIRDRCRQSGQPVPESAAQLARCVFDSLALSYQSAKEELESLRGRKLSRIRIIGGGSQNQLLNQLCADACGLPVIAGPVEASVLGNLSAQMIALGAVEDLDAARALIRASFPAHTYQPAGTVPGSAIRLFQQLQSPR